jgi:hypothetical protein
MRVRGIAGGQDIEKEACSVVISTCHKVNASNVGTNGKVAET